MTVQIRACHRHITALMFLIALLALTSANAQTASSARNLQRFSGNVNLKMPLHKETQIYVVKLADAPVAIVRSQMPGKRISEIERIAVVNLLRAKQDAMAPMIESTGGRVLAKFQHAINGIKVRATAEQAAQMAKLPGVVAVKRVGTYYIDNAESVPFIGAPLAWQGPPGLRGEHIKLAIIDTGIDYTHANFGGPGTPAAFTSAQSTSTQPADPTMFGPDAPKVKGGIDLAGDAYNAADPANNVPAPDPNPLDCNGHGSHTAGTAGGFGVTAAGNTYTGPYDTTTPNVQFTIGPGVAPLADIYSIRVFGCSGSTSLVVDAIDWAVQNDMQVVSMSLGSNFGPGDTADAEASDNAIDAGIVVVAASGNSGPVAYITSSPASGERVISTAAVDSHVSFPAASLTLSPSGTIVALDANGIQLGDGTILDVVVLPGPNGTVSLGCDPNEYTNAGVSGKLVVTARGTCARVDRAIYGQEAGALAVAMINSAAGYPPYEGPITQNPDTHAPYNVSIPFLGIQGPASSSDATAITAASSATSTATTIANPTARQVASFSSSGPRNLNGILKPNIAAPGVSIFSTAMGTGNGGLFESGTSMATPHVAGSAALAIQAHPSWSAETVADAVVNTADSSKVSGFTPQTAGNGLVQPFPATLTSVTASAVTDHTPSLNFGVQEVMTDYKGTADFLLENHGSTPVTFSISTAQNTSSPHTVTATPGPITLGANASRTVHVKLYVPVATIGNSSAFRQVQGQIQLQATRGNNGVGLSVPYYMVPRARSDVKTTLRKVTQTGATRSAKLGVGNSSVVPGTADFYAWGLSGSNSSLGYVGLRAVGVQSFASGPNQILRFAVNTFGRISSEADLGSEIYIDVNGDNIPDYAVVGEDLGLLQGLAATGQYAAAVFNLTTGSGIVRYLGTAPNDGSTVLLPVLASDLGITSGNPRFNYSATTYSTISNDQDFSGPPASFNAFNSSISTGEFLSLPGKSAPTPVTLSIDTAESAITPALGAMVVSLDNQTANGGQAALVPISVN